MEQSNTSRNDALVITKDGNTTIDGTITATAFVGDGSGLSGVAGGAQGPIGQQGQQELMGKMGQLE